MLNFAVGVTDITGVPVNLAGTYNTRGPKCLSVTSDPVPDLCLPLTVSVTAANAIGTNSSERVIGMVLGNLMSGSFPKIVDSRSVMSLVQLTCCVLYRSAIVKITKCVILVFLSRKCS